MLLAPANEAHVFNGRHRADVGRAGACPPLRAGTVLAPLAANTWTRYRPYRAGDNDAATGALRRALVLDPANPDALDLAACYRLARRRRKPTCRGPWPAIPPP